MRKFPNDILKDFLKAGAEFHKRNPAASLESIRKACLAEVKAYEDGKNRLDRPIKGNDVHKVFRQGYEDAHSAWINAGRPELEPLEDEDGEEK